MIFRNAFNHFLTVAIVLAVGYYCYMLGSWLNEPAATPVEILTVKPAEIPPTVEAPKGQ